ERASGAVEGRRPARQAASGSGRLDAPLGPAASRPRSTARRGAPSAGQPVQGPGGLLPGGQQGDAQLGDAVRSILLRLPQVGHSGRDAAVDASRDRPCARGSPRGSVLQLVQPRRGREGSGEPGVSHSRAEGAWQHAAAQGKERSTGLSPPGARPEPRTISWAGALCDGRLGDGPRLAGDGVLFGADVQDLPAPHRVLDAGCGPAGPAALGHGDHLVGAAAGSHPSSRWLRRPARLLSPGQTVTSDAAPVALRLANLLQGFQPARGACRPVEPEAPPLHARARGGLRRRPSARGDLGGGEEEGQMACRLVGAPPREACLGAQAGGQHDARRPRVRLAGGRPPAGYSGRAPRRAPAAQRESSAAEAGRRQAARQAL
ncbi:unnamed protein product, partial [Prorocentrum cordatum]